MKFSNLVTALVGAQVVYGAALTEKRRERNAARLAARKSNVRLPATNSEGFEIQGSESSNDTAHVEYSSNWSGAVLIGTGYKSVTGTFVVPTPKVPTGGSTSTQVSLICTLHAFSILRISSSSPKGNDLGTILHLVPKDIDPVTVCRLSLGRDRR